MSVEDDTAGWEATGGPRLSLSTNHVSTDWGTGELGLAIGLPTGFMCATEEREGKDAQWTGGAGFRRVRIIIVQRH